MPPKRKINNDGDNGDGSMISTKITNQKCFLNRLCKSESLRDTIDEQVIKMSMFYVEASVYCHYLLNKLLIEHHQNSRKKEFVLPGGKSFIADCFNSLKLKLRQSKKMVERHTLDKDYGFIRDGWKLTKYSVLMHNSFNCMYQQYETMLKNNIWMHAYNRVQRFVIVATEKERDKYSMTRIYNGMRGLFNIKPDITDNSKQVKNSNEGAFIIKIILDKLEHPIDDEKYFYGIKHNPYKYLLFFHRLQRYNEENALRNFILFPQMHAGRKYMHVDTSDLRDLLLHAKIISSEEAKWTNFKLNTQKYWKMYFHIERFETAAKKFDNSIYTDGVGVSVQLAVSSTEEKCNKSLKRLKSVLDVKKQKLTTTTSPPPPPANILLKYMKSIEKTKLNKIKSITNTPQPSNKIKSSTSTPNYTKIVGIDPGERLMLGGIEYFIDEKTNEITHHASIKIKSATYHYDTGEMSRRARLKKYTRDPDIQREAAEPSTPIVSNNKNGRRRRKKRPPHPMNKAQLLMIEINKKYNIVLSHGPKNYKIYTAWRLQYINYLQHLYTQRRVAHLKMEKYIRVERTLHEYRRRLAPPTHHTFIAWGSSNLAANSIIQGYVRTPKRKLLNLLEESKNCTVYLQNEFRTSKLCSCCHQSLAISKSPNRFSVCQNCKIVWNRDVNAANNILQLALNGNTIPNPFKK